LTFTPERWVRRRWSPGQRAGSGTARRQSGGTSRASRGRPRAARRPIPERAWGARRVAIVASAVVLCAGMGFVVSKASRWALGDEQFPLSRLTVAGNRLLTEDEVLELTGLDLGTNLLSIDIADVEEAVEGSPRVERARAARVLPDEIVVRLDERDPAAIVATGGGAWIEVTEDGLVLPSVERTSSVDVPLITGAVGAFDPDAAAASAEVVAVLEILGEAMRVSPALWMEISEVRIAPGSGLVIYTVADGAEIRVGSGALDSRGLRRLWMVLEDLRRRGGEVESMDLGFRNQVVVRLKSGSTRGSF